MADDRWVDIFKFNLNKNHDKFDGTTALKGMGPNYGNSKITVPTAIAPGNYKVGAWQWEDGNISVTIQIDKEMEGCPALPDAPAVAAPPPAVAAPPPPVAERSEDDDLAF